MELGRTTGAMKFKVMKIFICSFLLASTMAAVVVLGLHFYATLGLYPKVLADQEKIKIFEKSILHDLKTLEKFPAFKKNEYRSDASAYLQTLIPAQKNSSKNNQVVERLFNAYPNWGTNKVHFRSLTSDRQFANLDPRWLEKLKPFDHWNQNALEDVRNRIQHATSENGLQRMASLASLPFPDYALLRNWAAVYAIKKLQAKDLNAGLKVYRKVAELINSTGTLPAQMQAAAMLKLEHKLMNDFQARDWQLIPISSIDAYRRLSWAWISLTRQPFYGELKPEFKNNALPQFGVCASIEENLLSLFGTRGFLEPQFWFEKSFAPQYARAQEFQKLILDRCHATDFSNYIELSSVASGWTMDPKVLIVAKVNNDAPEFWQRLNFSRVPFLRRVFGLQLLLVASPDPFNLYRDTATDRTKL